MRSSGAAGDGASRGGAEAVSGVEAARGASHASTPAVEELEAEVEPAPRRAGPLATTRPSESHAGGRWAWTTLRHPGTVGVLRSLAWDGYGRCLAATNEGLLFWNGMGWCAIPSSSLPKPDGVRFVHKIGPGRWLVGGDASMLAAYTTGGLAGIIQRPGAPEQFVALSGDAEDMGVLAAVPEEGPILLRTFVGKRWLRPCSVGGVAHFASLARVEDETWLLACRTGGGRGMLALYSPLEWHLERLPAPDVRAYIACTGAQESGLGLAVGTEGTAVWCVERRGVAETVDARFDLSAVALGGDGSAWAASAGRIWRRAPATPGAGVWEGVWGDDAWVAPVISLFVDFGVVVAVTADGGILEGRLV